MFLFGFHIFFVYFILNNEDWIVINFSGFGILNGNGTAAGESGGIEWGRICSQISTPYIFRIKILSKHNGFAFWHCWHSILNFSGFDFFRSYFFWIILIFLWYGGKKFFFSIVSQINSIKIMILVDNVWLSEISLLIKACNPSVGLVVSIPPSLKKFHIASGFIVGLSFRTFIAWINSNMILPISILLSWVCSNNGPNKCWDAVCSSNSLSEVELLRCLSISRSSICWLLIKSSLLLWKFILRSKLCNENWYFSL